MRDEYSDLSIRMKAFFAKAQTADEKQRIVDKFVKTLRADGLSDEEIIKIGNIELLLEAQGNRVMISNTEAYKLALAKALGGKK
jgi:hypothetical protein